MWYLVLIINSLLNVDKSDITTKTIQTHYVLFRLFPNFACLEMWKSVKLVAWWNVDTTCFRISCPREGGSQAVRHGKFLGAGLTFTWACRNNALQKFTALGQERKTIKIKRYWQAKSPDIKEPYCLDPEEECSKPSHFLYRNHQTSIVSLFGEV